MGNDDFADNIVPKKENMMIMNNRAHGKLSYTKDVIYEKLHSAPVGFTFVLWTPEGAFMWKRVPLPKQKSQFKICGVDEPLPDKREE